MSNSIRLLGLSSLAFAIHFAPVGHVDPCTPLFNALTAVLKVPYTAMTTVNNKPPVEEIVANGTVYIQVDGKWAAWPHSLAEEEAKIEKARKEPKNTCRQEPDAIVNGENTVVYFGRLTNEATTSENRLWVSKRTGLPLKTEMQVDAGLSMSMTYRYDHVQVPAVPKA